MPVRGECIPVDPLLLPIWEALDACEGSTENEALLEKIGAAYDALLAVNRKLVGEEKA